MVPTIVISADRLHALLHLPGGREVPRELLRRLIDGAGIRFGLRPEALALAIQADAADRALEIAIGHAPTPATDETLDPPWDAAAARDLAAGEELGRIVPGTPGTPGMAVDGVALPAPPPAPLRLGGGLERAGDCVRATRPGRLVREPDGTLTVPLPGGARRRERTDIVIQLDMQQIEAFIVLDAGDYVPPAVLRGALERLGITTGVSEEQIQAAAAPGGEQRRLVLARGRPMEPGADAQLEHLVEVVQVVAEPDGSGRIDPRERGKWTEVDPGTPLARVVPATAGVAGITVKGLAIEAKAGRALDINRVRGEGTDVDARDANVLNATVSGIVRRNDRGVTSVVPKLEIRGDLDMHTGNIDTRFPVHIGGDLKVGFVVKSAASIAVAGSIEDARVSAAGDLVVRGGILPGNERVKARGDISVRHAEGRTLKARSVTVAGDLRNCTVLATGSVTAKSIAGGSVTCTGSVEVGDLGDFNELKTRILAGVNPFLATVYRGAQARVAEAEHDADSLRERVQLLTHRIKQRIAGRFDVGNDKHTLAKTMREYEAAVALLRDCRNAFAAHEGEIARAEAAPSLARIVVKGAAWPGVEIGIGETAVLVLKERLTRPVFVLKDGVILVIG
jgi:hypothetical protein